MAGPRGLRQRLEQRPKRGRGIQRRPRREYEDVATYVDGVIDSDEGTWLVGRDGPLAMIMPGRPQSGQVYRPENAPGFAFEEVRITEVDVELDGPLGKVLGCMVADQVHLDGRHDEKAFCPGYGETLTALDGNLEAICLAVPADALATPSAAELDALSNAANDLWAAADGGDFATVTPILGTIRALWTSLRPGAPTNLAPEMERAIVRAETQALAARKHETKAASIEVARWALDLHLRHHRVHEIDRARFELWLRQVIVDADLGDVLGVIGDVATLEWVRDRIAHTFSASDRDALDAILAELRSAADAGLLSAANAAAEDLRRLVGPFTP